MNIEQQLMDTLIGLGIGTLLGNEISRYLYKPRVKVKVRDVNPLITSDGYFMSIDIINIGRSVATNCMGYLSINGISSDDIMEEHEAVTNESLPSYRDEKIDLSYPRTQMVTPLKFREIKNVSLCWAQQGNPCELNINPGMTTALDLCKVQKTGQSYWYLIFPSEKGWRKVRFRMRFREITGRLFLCPSNEYPTIIDFKICNVNDKPQFQVIKYNLFQRMVRRIFRSKLLMK